MAETTKALSWDDTGKRFYETGVSKGVLYPQVNGTYPKGVAWNGLINVTEKPTGADATPLYANNKKYLNLYSKEDFEASVECYTYPDEFADCDGSAVIAKGARVGQQRRKPFGLSYTTIVGNDVDGDDHGYKLHLIYGAIASPSEKSYGTETDNVEALTFSYELKTTPVEIEGFEPAASITIDSRTADPQKLKELEVILYGSESADPRLPLPSEVVKTLGVVAAG